METSKYLITSALPYANGPIHFGHMAGAYLPADIFTRFKKMCGHDAIHISGTDEHGFAITVSAKKEKRTPLEHVNYYNQIIQKIFKKFDIEFDHFSRTTHQGHYKLSQDFFKNLLDDGKISQKTTEQYFCNSCDLFLADRYIIGSCPYCDYDDARGDECEKCGEWLDALEIVQPKCKICKDTPIKKETIHWFLNLNLFSDQLKKWIDSKEGKWKSNVTHFISAMIERGLNPRAVTRDMDWGIPVPVDGVDNKVLYVWFDAPIGYISATKEWAENQGSPNLWESYWKDSNCKLIHFIGKDNLPFHCVVWPSILSGQKSDYILPYNVPANEFYHLEGKPFSKSRGWYIDLERFFSKYQTDSIRYAIASNAPETKDSSFTWKQFQSAHNSDLADTLGNFINRVFVFTHKYAENKVPSRKDLSITDKNFLKQISVQLKSLQECYDGFHLRKATSQIMLMAREGNKFFDEKAPWSSRKTNIQDCYNTLNLSLVLIYNLACIFYPILPNKAKELWKMLNVSQPKNVDFSCQELSVKHELGESKVLFTKITDEEIDEEMSLLTNMSS